MGGVVEGYEWSGEWIEVTEEGVALRVEASGSGEEVEELRAAAEGRFELEIRWLGGAVELEVRRKGRRHLLRVEVGERPWFLVRSELERLMLELGGEEVLRRAIDDLCSALLDP